MEKQYLQLAAAHENLAACYRQMAPESKVVTEEEIRTVLSLKSKAGKQKQIRELLFKYDSGKLSGVKPSDYAALLAEAELL